MFTGERIVHIHPTRLCNLRCLHCYSTSGPSRAEALPLDDLLETTGQLAAAGYTRSAISGGEPTLYPAFADLCRNLVDQGFRVSAITNGWDPSPLPVLMETDVLSVVGISFDGLGPTHDRNRARAGSFDRALRTLRQLGAAGHSVGAVIAVTRASLTEIPDLAGILAENGAHWVQLHPIAHTGRATGVEALAALPAEALLRLLLLSELLRRRYPELSFQCDVTTGHTVPDIVPPARPISPVVIEEDGCIVPYVYGMPRNFALGRVGETLNNTLPTAALLSVVAQSLKHCATAPATNPFQVLRDNAAAWSERS